MTQEELEGNLLDTQNDGIQNHDDDDDTLHDLDENLLSAEIITAAAANPNNDNPEEEEEEGLFEIEKAEEENKELSAEELAAFNKKMGTDFKSNEELKKSFQKIDNKNDEELEQIELAKYTKNVELFDQFIKMDDEELIRNQFISQAQLDKKDINSEEVKEEIEDKIQGLKDLDTLGTMAKNLRLSLEATKEKNQKAIDKIEEKNNKKVQDEADQNLQNLQNAFSEIFQAKQFMGVEVTKELITKVYASVKDKTFFERVNKDQGMIAKVALFVALEEEIQKRASAPTHSDKTKTAIDFLITKKETTPRSITNARNGAASMSDAENTAAFLK